jgi:hypothetical protein
MLLKLRFYDGCVAAVSSLYRVEHVYVNNGGQAVAGNVKKEDANGLSAA